ncbi:MAG TPA: hypothetical protein VF884_07815 [Nitrososphaeraceae archaeon]
MHRTPASALQVIAEQNSLKLFTVIASSNKIHSSDLKKQSALTKKEYYSRTSQMLKAGLIKRSSGFFRLTAFGVVMYEVCLRIDAAILEYSELKAIDSLKDTVNMEDSRQQNFLLIGDDVFSSKK